ncbi:hypothetical protein [uncultured Aquimarina sp.]|uniref:lipopolysaccharide biosynthesis protein n=1 Tax=uncultured Aquimarina sp. TaxID=575652 RepID=UPI002619AC16|nr:hypothetical protein [uncultured Aquimarina sp.]
MHKLLTIGINTLKGFSSPIFNFLIAVIGVKYYGKSDWGILINCMIWVFFIAFIVNWGNRDYLIRKYSKTPSKIYAIFYSNLLSRSILLTASLLLFIFFPPNTALYTIVLVVLIYGYTSLDSLVIYRQKFGAQLLSEILGFLTIIGGVLYYDSFNLVSFLQLYCLAFFFKTTYLVFALELFKQKFNLQISFDEIRDGFPFFLIGFSGWLQSKIDIYIVSFYLPKEQLSEYQLLITAFLMLQAISAFLITPFTKHIFRVSNKVLLKIKKKISLIATPIVLVGTFCIWIVLEKIVNLNISYNIYLLGGLSALPAYFYTINIMQLYKQHKEKKVILMGFIGAIINFTTIILFIRKYEIQGVFIGICCTQLIILVLYKLIAKKIEKHSPSSNTIDPQ